MSKTIPIKESRLVDIMNDIVTTTVEKEKDKWIAEAKEQWETEARESFISEQKDKWLAEEKQIWLKESKIVVEASLLKKINALEKEVKLLTK